MNLQNYIDGNGLVTPRAYDPQYVRGSDNGVLFSSIAFILEGGEAAFLALAILRCVDPDGTLRRSPGDWAPDAPDDHYGFLAFTGYNGTFKGTVPNLTLAPRLWQPVLVYLWLFSYHRPLSVLLAPLVTIIVALSNLNSGLDDTSNRIITWTTCQVLKKHGLITSLGAKIWEWRQRRIYGDFATLFTRYYSAEHPFIQGVKDYENIT